MQIVLATDPCDAPEERTPAEDILLRLRFTAAHLDVVHVIPFTAEALAATEQALTKELDQMLAERHSGADALVRAVASRFQDSPYPACTTVLEGRGAERLLGYAAETGADLIAANGATSRKGHPRREYTRDLTLGAGCSLLIARPGGSESSARHPHSLRAVLATDHSDYANRCVDRLLEFAPRGIGHLTVLSVCPQRELRAPGPSVAQAHSPAEYEGMLSAYLSEQNARLIARLKAGLCPGAEYVSRVATGPVQEAIAGVMAEQNADLLILGARSRGEGTRLPPGSVACYEALASPYSVLVLRAGAND